jgi:26S proteasome regulatory subunit N8
MEHRRRLPITAAVIHPVVLLGIVDHYNRSCKNTRKRAVGVLLGTIDARGQAEVLNSFAVPFEEDERNPTVFFFDHDYVENMAAMFRKVTARERIIGWYSTGPQIRSADTGVHEIVQSFCSTGHALYVICQVDPKEIGLPTEAYVCVEDEGVLFDSNTTGQQRRVFEHVPNSIGALEAEEVGTEHLLRDVRDVSVSTLTGEVYAKIDALKSLQARLANIRKYLEQVATGELPLHHEILFALQEVLSGLPRISEDRQLLQAFTLCGNDQSLLIYVATLVRSVLALHDLVNNKTELLENERKMEAAFATATTSMEPSSSPAVGDDGK